MDDSIIDMSDDEIIVKNVPLDSISPTTFSKKIVNCFGIKSQKRGTETVDTLSQTQLNYILMHPLATCHFCCLILLLMIALPSIVLH